MHGGRIVEPGSLIEREIPPILLGCAWESLKSLLPLSFLSFLSAVHSFTGSFCFYVLEEFLMNLL
jgi:hypothetical protein